MSLHSSFYKMAWDTRCRNVDVRRVLGQFPNATILDAGCGEYGLAAFMPSAKITGVDILAVEDVDPRLDYAHGSILDLPFEDSAFDVAVSVDVFEHLAEEVRGAAVSELVRVARKAVVIAFPAGTAARVMDEDFKQKLDGSGQPLPDWLAEHLQRPYPKTDDVVAAIEASGRKVAASIDYSENLAVAKFLRWSAVRSKYLYLTANMIAGILLPVMPWASRNDAYRSIIVAEFVND
jgi:SAM-dependent methyltransferase